MRAKRILFCISGIAVIIAGLYTGFLAADIYDGLESLSKRSVSRFYAAPLTLEKGGIISRTNLAEYLHLLGYTEHDTVDQPGQFNLNGSDWEIFSRSHISPSGGRNRSKIHLSLRDSQVRYISDSGRTVSFVELESPILGSFSENGDVARIPFTLKQIPPFLVDAFVSVEDRTFFEHHGLSLTSIVRAFWINLRQGGYRQGGSTITQQLAKNIFLSRDKTITRKIKEALIAVYIEARFSKDEILELYFNEVYMGQFGDSGVFGVGAAALHYFGLDVSGITLEQAALIAGTIKGPSYYNPFRHPKRALQRRNYVLERMVATGSLSKEVADEVRQRPLGILDKPGGVNVSGYFMDYLLKRDGIRFLPPATSSGQRHVFTTLDLSLQSAAEQAVRRGLKKLRAEKKTEQAQDLQAALVVLDPATGAVKAMIGGEDFGYFPFNRAVLAMRQPGSTFKPFVYATAFESLPGFNEQTPLNDEPISISDRHGGTWEPRNYSGKFRGKVPALDALSFSINLPTVALANQVGLKHVSSLAEKMGLGEKIKPLPSLALGSVEVSLLNLATAFASFANAGRPVEATPVLAVLDKDGKSEIKPEHSSLKSQVLSAETAFQVTHMLQDVIKRGTGRGILNYGIKSECAGKTGTTNDLRDAWFAGYTSGLLTVVWVGRDSGKSIGLTGAQAALPIWADFMSYADKKYPAGVFSMPTSISFKKICTETGLLASISCPSVLTPINTEGMSYKVCTAHSGPIERIKNRILKWLNGNFWEESP